MGANSNQLIVHVGAPKTGSTAIQTGLAVNQQELRLNGLDYVEHPNVELARNFKFNSGNGRRLLEPSYKQFKPGQIYSHEGLFFNLDPREFSQRVKENCELSPELQVVFIVYVRNPLELFSSMYSERVKAHGLTMNADEFFLTGSLQAHLGKLLWWLDCSADPAFHIKFFNYSNHKADLSRHFFSECLGVRDLSKFEFSYAAKKLNRRLSSTETQLFLALNKAANEKSEYRALARHLVESVDLNDGADPMPSMNAFVSAFDDLSSMVQEANQKLPHGEELFLPDHVPEPNSAPNGPSSPLCVSQDWVAALARGISELPRLRDSEVDEIRDLSLRIEAGEGLGLPDALFLMQLASRARPTGPLIRRKISQFESALGL